MVIASIGQFSAASKTTSSASTSVGFGLDCRVLVTPKASGALPTHMPERMHTP
jgi:hypothetical protein